MERKEEEKEKRWRILDDYRNNNDDDVNTKESLEFFLQILIKLETICLELFLRAHCSKRLRRKRNRSKKKERNPIVLFWWEGGVWITNKMREEEGEGGKSNSFSVCN